MRVRSFVATQQVVLACGLWSVASAGAKTVTVGQLVMPDVASCGGGYTILQTGVASGRSYRVPEAGVITSWSWYDGANTVPDLKLKVARNTAVALNFKIIAEATAGTQTPYVLHTYHAHIPVRARDLIGIYENGGSCQAFTSNSMDTVAEALGDLPRGNAAFASYADTKLPVSVKVALDCVVPNLKGKTLKAAEKSLKSNSCTLGTVNGPRTGTVESQKPAAGKTLAPEAKVNIRLG
jgi:hypothetical protein